MTLRNIILFGALVAFSVAAGFVFFEQTQEGATASVLHVEKDTVTMRPVFSLDDVTGKERSITEWDGKALIVNFWATWCAPCRREIPLLIEIQNEMADKNIQIIGIAIDEPDAVTRYAEQAAFNYPILVGEQAGIDAAEAFGADVVALPMTVFTDPNGKIINIHAGEISRSEILAILKTLPQ